MAFTQDKFLPSGYYAIVNVAYNRPIFFSEHGECLSTSNEDYRWIVMYLQTKKWTIQGPQGVFVDMSPDPREGEDVISVKNPTRPHQWIIKRHSSHTGAYIIYSPSQPRLFWSLTNGDEGTVPQLSHDHDSDSSLWRFKRIYQDQDGKAETVGGPSGFQYIYYRVFYKETAIVTKHPAYLDDPYIGRIQSKWVAPPHNAASLRRCLSSMENIDRSKTKLYATPSSKTSIEDDTPVALRLNQTMGILPEEPLVLLSGVPPENGLKPGTESLRISSDAESPLLSQFLYYGLYNEDGVTASKDPIDEEEFWISALNLDFIPPPRTVASLMRLVSAREGVTGFSQIFADKNQMAPLKRYHPLIEEGHWLGSTADDHIVFKSILFDEGRPYRILNAATERALIMQTNVWPACDVYLIQLTLFEDYERKAVEFTFKCMDDGGVAVRGRYSGRWIAPDELKKARTEEQSLYFVPSESNSDKFFICVDNEHRRAFCDSDDNSGRAWDYWLGVEDFNGNDKRQMWYLVAS